MYPLPHLCHPSFYHPHHAVACSPPYLTPPQDSTLPPPKQHHFSSPPCLVSNPRTCHQHAPTAHNSSPVYEAGTKLHQINRSYYHFARKTIHLDSQLPILLHTFYNVWTHLLTIMIRSSLHLQPSSLACKTSLAPTSNMPTLFLHQESMASLLSTPTSPAF